MRVSTPVTMKSCPRQILSFHPRFTYWLCLTERNQRRAWLGPGVVFLERSGKHWLKMELELSLTIPLIGGLR